MSNGNELVRPRGAARQLLDRELAQRRSFDPLRGEVELEPTTLLVVGALWTPPHTDGSAVEAALEEAHVADVPTICARRHTEPGSRTVRCALGRGASAHLIDSPMPLSMQWFHESATNGAHPATFVPPLST
jgi:hypothetical protein